MTMQLSYPLKISARLLPAVQIGPAWVSLEYLGERCFHWYIDVLKDGKAIEFAGEDFRLPMSAGSGDLSDFYRKAMASFLSFLQAFAEAVEYETRSGRKSDNSQLFPAGLRDWAVEFQDDIMLAQLEL